MERIITQVLHELETTRKTHQGGGALAKIDLNLDGLSEAQVTQLINDIEACVAKVRGNRPLQNEYYFYVYPVSHQDPAVPPIGGGWIAAIRKDSNGSPIFEVSHKFVSNPDYA